MGVPLLWPHIRQEGHEATLLRQFPQGPLPPDALYRVDLLASFFPSIRRIFSSSTHDYLTSNVIFERHLVSSRIPKASSVLYIDGPSPEEKRETRQLREEKRIVALQKAHIWLCNMETRVGGRRRVRKRDFTKLDKLIRAAFYWTPDARASLAIYLRVQGWTVIECPSEADIAIAIDSQPQDIVVSGDSDMLIYATVHTIWRPISRGKYLVYDLPKVLSYLGISRLALTVLGIVCKNDYTSNLTRMGLSTNIKILKSLEEMKDPAAGVEPVTEANVETMVKRYLAHPEVVRRNPAATHFEAAVRVFAGRQFKVAVATTPSQPSDHTSSTNCSTQKSSDLAALLERLRVLRQRLNENKKSLVADQLVQQTDVFNRYATVDRPPDQRPPPHSSGRRYKHRQRYAIKTRSQVVKHEPPEAMKQNQWKPYKSAPDSPLEPQSAVSSSKPKSPKRLPSAEGMDKKDLVNAMARDHPMRTLDIGTVNANATRGLNREFGPEGSSVYLPRVKIALRDIAHQSSHVKRVCQRAIGLYLERLALSINESVVPAVPAVPVVPALPMVMDVVGTIESVQPLQQQPLQQQPLQQQPLQQQPLQQQPLQKQASKLHAEDRLILDKLCPKFTAKDIADGRNINDGTTEDLTKPDDSEHDETLDKKNEPLQFLMCLLNAVYSGKLPKRQKGKEKGGAPSIDSPSAVCTFIERARDFLPAITKDGDGLERDFAGSSFLRSTALQLSVELKKHYRNGSTDLCEKIALLKTKKLLPLEARDCVDPDITAFENFVLLNRVCGCPRSLVPMSSFENKFITVSELELARIFWRDPMLKTVLQSYAWPDFPSIEYADQVSQTDVGMWLSRAVPGCLITKLLTDIGGYSEVERKRLRSYSRSTRLMPLEDTRRHIQQIRHADFQPTSYTDKGYVLHGSIRTDGFRLQLIAFKMNELHSVKYRQLPADRLPNRLTSTVAGTDYFLTEIRNVVSTPQDVVDLWGCDPKRIKILGIDLGQAFVVGASALLPSRNKHLDAEGGPEGAQKDPLVKQPTTKYFNLAVKQKAVYQPTLKHRRWLEQRKAQPLEGGGSICQIETSLPARFGPDASIAGYTTRMQEVEAQLGSFYGSVVLKKHRWNARKARDEEYRLIANRLLEMVGGSLGAKRKESNKIVIGVGLGQFSSRIRLSSLHESFESYFIQKARSLGYIVVGVNEYYTSKKCPTCGEFVGQVDLRRLYCSECKKYMHRDVMAGHNICNVIRGHLLKQERPRYLQPKDIDGNYPWEEKQSFRPRPEGSGAGGHKGKGVKRKATDEGTDSSQFRRVAV